MITPRRYTLGDLVSELQNMITEGRAKTSDIVMMRYHKNEDVVIGQAISWIKRDGFYEYLDLHGDPPKEAKWPRRE